MTPDSAWRQFRGATRDLRAAEEREKAARAIWLQVLLEGFDARRLDADADGRDVSSKKAIAELGLPCRDCLAPVPPNLSGHSLVNGRDGDTFKLYAVCGKAAIDPVATSTMPALYTMPEPGSR
jgi:hypothetical protein